VPKPVDGIGDLSRAAMSPRSAAIAAEV